MKMAAVTGVVNDVEKNKYQYSKVSLSLENCILPSEKLIQSPSQIDGLDQEAETELRILGCELIQTSGILLRLPQVAMATGQVLFQRFFYSKSFVRQGMEVVAMACITLASKIEEAPRRMRDVINVFHHIKQMKAEKIIQPLILDQNYINLKNQVIKAERRVLKELGFCVHIKHPHKIIVTLLEVLKVKDRTLMQTAWNYMNDSLRTEVFVRYDPETIACSCIHLSAKLLQIPLPNKPAWYMVFGVQEGTINEISHIILSLYTRKKPDPEKLEKLVEELKKTYNEAKQKAKENSLANNAAHLSPLPPGSPRNGVKSPNGDVKKDKNHKHSETSPRHNKESGRKRGRGASVSPHTPRKRIKSSTSSGSSSPSPPRRKGGKTPPRSFKERSRSRSKGKSSSNKKHRHSSHKRRQHSTSPSRKSATKIKHRSRSRSPHERFSNHHTNSVHEKSHKSNRRERVKENHRDKKRR